MKLIEVTTLHPKFIGREPKDESEVVAKKASFFPQNLVAMIEENEKPVVKTRIELAGGVGFLVAESIDELTEKINELVKECQ